MGGNQGSAGGQGSMGRLGSAGRAGSMGGKQGSMAPVPVKKAAPVKKAPVAGGRFTYDSGVEWDTQGAESVLSVPVKTLDQLSDPSESGVFVNFRHPLN